MQLVLVSHLNHQRPSPHGHRLCPARREPLQQLHAPVKLISIGKSRQQMVVHRSVTTRFNIRSTLVCLGQHFQTVLAHQLFQLFARWLLALVTFSEFQRPTKLALAHGRLRVHRLRRLALWPTIHFRVRLRLRVQQATLIVRRSPQLVKLANQIMAGMHHRHRFGTSGSPPRRALWC